MCSVWTSLVEGPQTCQLCMEPRKDMTPMDLLLFFSFGSDYSMVLGEVVADQNVYGTCGKS